MDNQINILSIAIALLTAFVGHVYTLLRSEVGNKIDKDVLDLRYKVLSDKIKELKEENEKLRARINIIEKDL